MPNPLPPSTPNFNPGVGRLATDRYDFQNHITGEDFRHQAKHIDLFPTVVIGSEKTNVQDAITALSIAISPPVIQEASPTHLGIIQLTGDINGVANNVKVTGLQGKPISANAPVLNNVLTWNGTAWIPSAATNAFTAGGDLAGNNILQQVVGLAGDGSGNVSANCTTIKFNQAVVSPTIMQTTTSVGQGNNLNLLAQGTTAVSNSGGYVIISGGRPGASGGLRGGVRLQMNSGAGGTDLVQLTEPILGQRVLALLTGGLTPLSPVSMPANSGDLVMFIGNSPTPPTTGTPNGGAIMYASGGQVFIKQSDGNNFAIGSIPNPSIWGATGQQTSTSRNYVTSLAATPVTLIFALDDNAATKIDVILVGKEVSTNNSAQYNLSMGYMRTSGAPVAVGSITSSDPRSSAGASGWTPPTINVSGNNVQVVTGASNTGSNINWFVVTQLSISQG